MTLTDSDDGRRLTARLGGIIEIHLAENATTGYSWALDHLDAKQVELVETKANYPNAAPGSGGEAIFRFRVIGTGTEKLVLKYWRHWEGAKSILRRFSATIDVLR